MPGIPYTPLISEEPVKRVAIRDGNMAVGPIPTDVMDIRINAPE